MKKIAQMAMLDIDDVKRLMNDVKQFVEIAAPLSELDCEKTIEQKECVMREDIPAKSRTKSVNGYISVPKVVGE